MQDVLNKIIQNSHFKKKVSLEEQRVQKEGRFLRGRQIAFMIYDYFMMPYWIMLIYSRLFFKTIMFRVSIQDGMKFTNLCQQFHLWIWMCVPWYHRLCDKHFDEGATRCCIWEQCPQLLRTLFGDLDLEIRTLSANVTESAAWIEVTRPWFLLQTYCEQWKCVNRRLPCCRGMVWSHDCCHATVTWAVLEQSKIPSLSLAFFVGCVCLYCTVSSAYISVHKVATHMCHLPYHCHLHL